jgi:hypothetical protein
MIARVQAAANESTQMSFSVDDFDEDDPGHKLKEEEIAKVEAPLWSCLFFYFVCFHFFKSSF